MKKNPIQIVPSLLSSDFGHLADEVKRVEEAGADALHVDIMDGHFVPNLTLGPKAVEAINKVSNIFLDVHLMIYQPFEYIESFVSAGADRITIHFEATEDVEDTLNYIRKCNVEAGLAFCPETSVSMVEPFLDKCDLILLMTVHPGFGGQSFMSEVLEKIRLTRKWLTERGIDKHGKENSRQAEREFLLQVDGGINEETGKLCVQAGANALVSGSHLFKQKDLQKAISSLRNCASR